MRNKDNSIGIIFFILYLLQPDAKAQEDNSLRGNFPPNANPENLYAKPVTDGILVDGKLDEKEWSRAIPVPNFMQIEPSQGESTRYPTSVKLLFDDKYIYIGAFCEDTAGKKGVRVRDFSRDFNYFNNDLFSVALDPFNNKQNAVVFQVNPYGVLSDLQVVNGLSDYGWNAVWTSRTNITESGWNCEIAIPWKTIRYPTQNDDSTAWGISFNRIARRDNENSAFPGYPRSFVNMYRMDYVASLKGIKPPPPSINFHINPYLINQLDIKKGDETGTVHDFSSNFGGELKWSPTVYSTIDITVNTDFAQAEVDRAVNNLGRFPVIFPEKRQFFLENAGLFNAGNDAAFKPFHSRTIGLDNNGRPIKIDAGIRYVEKHREYSVGALYIHQASSSSTQPANIGVVSFIKNYGDQNNIGALITNRIDEAKDSLKLNINTTATLTGFNRFSDKLRFKYSFSGSHTTGNDENVGAAAATGLLYSANDLYLEWNFSLVSDQYTPLAGYTRRRGFYKNYSKVYLDKREQKWLPQFVRSWQPGFTIDEFHYLEDLSFQEVNLRIIPLLFVFNSGANFSLSYRLDWQNLHDAFTPMDILIASGRYNYSSVNIDFSSDQSSKLSLEANVNIGGYYNGKITSYSGGVRYAPIPHFTAILNHELNILRQVGVDKERLTTQLTTLDIRLALNPRIIGNLFYEYNTVTDQSTWNTRLSWEYVPSSYIYLVWTQNKEDRFKQDQGILKMSYLRQF